jgi:hypothetical protein
VWARRVEEHRMTYLLITILTSFIFLTTPNTMVKIWALWLKDREDFYSGSGGFNPRAITAPANLLLTCNYSLNFYLYCLASRSQALLF